MTQCGWTAYPSGGVTPYTYYWSGPDGTDREDDAVDGPDDFGWLNLNYSSFVMAVSAVDAAGSQASASVQVNGTGYEGQCGY